MFDTVNHYIVEYTADSKYSHDHDYIEDSKIAQAIESLLPLLIRFGLFHMTHTLMKINTFIWLHLVFLYEIQSCMKIHNYPNLPGKLQKI